MHDDHDASFGRHHAVELVPVVVAATRCREHVAKKQTDAVRIETIGRIVGSEQIRPAGDADPSPALSGDDRHGSSTAEVAESCSGSARHERDRVHLGDRMGHHPRVDHTRQHRSIGPSGADDGEAVVGGQEVMDVVDARHDATVRLADAFVGTYCGCVIDEVLVANLAFYEAHESRDLRAMSASWEHSDRVVCIHPGWPILRTWPAVEESWRRILSGPGRNQFILTNEAVVIDGELAWVTLDENLVDGGGTGTVAATNLFVRDHSSWLLVAHHGSPVVMR